MAQAYCHEHEMDPSKEGECRVTEEDRHALTTTTTTTSPPPPTSRRKLAVWDEFDATRDTVQRTSGTCHVHLTETECSEWAVANGLVLTAPQSTPLVAGGCRRNALSGTGLVYYNSDLTSTSTCDSAALEYCVCGRYRANMLPRDRCGGNNGMANYPYGSRSAANQACVDHGCTGLADSLMIDQPEFQWHTPGGNTMNDGHRCYAGWYQNPHRDGLANDRGIWWMRPGSNPSAACGGAPGFHEWQSTVGGAACEGCPRSLNFCPSPPPSPPPPPCFVTSTFDFRRACAVPDLTQTIVPNNPPTETRYKRVMTVGDRDVDIKLTFETGALTYTTGCVSGNATGMAGLGFTFTDAVPTIGVTMELRDSDTDALTNANFYFTMLDIDVQITPAFFADSIMIAASEYSEYTLVDNTKVTVDTSDPAAHRFYHDGTTNVPLQTSTERPANVDRFSVTLRFDNKNTVQFRLGDPNFSGGFASRQFMFDGQSAFSPECPSPSTPPTSPPPSAPPTSPPPSHPPPTSPPPTLPPPPSPPGINGCLCAAESPSSPPPAHPAPSSPPPSPRGDGRARRDPRGRHGDAEHARGDELDVPLPPDHLALPRDQRAYDVRQGGVVAGVHGGRQVRHQDPAGQRVPHRRDRDHRAPRLRRGRVHRV